MSVNESGFQRARTAEHKEQRAEALLGAARELAAAKGVREVTLTAIAIAAGVHVSAVRRYFESREDIYLRLAAQEWAEWVDALAAALGAGQGLPEAIAGTLGERPLFCDLLGHVQVSFEREVTLESVWDFKLKAVAQADRLAELCRRALPELDEQAGRDLVAAIVGMAAMTWQSAHPPVILAGLYEADPRLAHTAVEFVPRLTRLVRTFLSGLIAQA
ncbi:MAG TPA: TetR family transcriptional regulator [Pseudonocardiaceae bacterium]|nr:TetR family transcriptional regulator [Pseudonocardiaceae bacterium]